MSVRLAYECTVCGALWPHPSFKCSGIGGFADHPESPTRLVRVIDESDCEAISQELRREKADAERERLARQTVDRVLSDTLTEKRRLRTAIRRATALLNDELYGEAWATLRDVDNL